MKMDDLNKRIAEHEKNKVWNKLAKPVQIDSDELKRGKAAFNRLFDKWNKK